MTARLPRSNGARYDAPTLDLIRRAGGAGIHPLHVAKKMSRVAKQDGRKLTGQGIADIVDRLELVGLVRGQGRPALLFGCAPPADGDAARLRAAAELLRDRQERKMATT